jgi:DNA-binding NarL/FixJ family response regulator
VILASLDEGHLNVSARIIMSSQPDMEMVAQAGNAEQAIAEFRLTLMDLSLPGTNGTDTLIAIRGEFPNAQIIMLTMSEGDGEIQRAMRAGALSRRLRSALMPPCPSRRPDHRSTKAIDSRRRSSVGACGSTTASV